MINALPKTAKPHLDHSPSLGCLDLLDELLSGGRPVSAADIEGEQIGAGGMGQVVAGKRIISGKTTAVAIKTIDPETPVSLANQMLRSEAAALQSVNHPNVVEHFGTETRVDGRDQLIMGLVSGRDLRSILRGGEIITGEQKRQLVLGLLSAVAACHREDVVHRDIKPANVMITEDWQPVLVDFGIALLRDDRQTCPTSNSMYTRVYAAPEQLSKGPVSKATDVYQLGLLIFELYTGYRPFFRWEGKPKSLLRARTQPETHLVLNELVPSSLHKCLVRALAAKTTDRYRDAEEFLQEVRQALSN